MDLPVFIFTATACIASLILVFIPLRRDVYDRHSHRYTLSGKWFILLALVAIFSGLGALFLQFVGNANNDQAKLGEKVRFHRTMDSLDQVSAQKFASLQKDDSLHWVEARRKIIDSLVPNHDSTLLARLDSLKMKKSDSLSKRGGKTTKAKPTVTMLTQPLLKNVGELSADEKMLLLNSVERAKQRYHLKTQCIEVSINRGASPGKFVPHLQQYLKKLGYTVTDKKEGLVTNFFYGVIITAQHGSCISIEVGSLAKSPVIFRVQ